MTLEELAQKLKELGIEDNSWREIGDKAIPPPLVSAYKPMLLEVRKIISSELGKKVAEREKLHEMLGKLRHGGAM